MRRTRFFFQLIRCTAIAAALFVRMFSITAAAQSLQEVLDGVSKNVQDFQDLLPDFVCNEKVTSTKFESGKVIKAKSVESVFTGLQRSSEENRVRFAFSESRTVVAIDGKPVRQGTAFPKLPYRFSGAFSSLLSTTFARENLQIHNYSIADTYKSGNSSALLIRFATKENQKELRGIFQDTQLIAKDVGAAWIDQKSFRVLRLQRRALNLPPGIARSIATVDYGPVRIGETEFWMPMKIQAEVDERNSAVTFNYAAEYSNCNKFMADVKILP